MPGHFYEGVEQWSLQVWPVLPLADRRAELAVGVAEAGVGS
jgi:hypothetical protein